MGSSGLWEIGEVSEVSSDSCHAATKSKLMILVLTQSMIGEIVGCSGCLYYSGRTKSVESEHP